MQHRQESITYKVTDAQLIEYNQQLFQHCTAQARYYAKLMHAYDTIILTRPALASFSMLISPLASSVFPATTVFT